MNIKKLLKYTIPALFIGLLAFGVAYADNPNFWLPGANSTLAPLTGFFARFSNKTNPDPTGQLGEIYYNTTLGVFRCYTGSWVNCDTTGGSGTVSGGIKGYVTTWASSTGLTTGLLIDDGQHAGVTATSSLYAFNIQGTFNVTATSTLATTTATNLTVIQLSSCTNVQTTVAGLFQCNNTSYLTGNQNITLSGDVTGSGMTAIPTTYNGIVPVNKGGTNTSTAATQLNQILGWNNASYGAVTLINGANITITTSTAGSLTIAATGLQTTLTLPLSVSNGGTGSNNITANDILFGNGTNPIATSSSLTWDGTKFTTTNASTTNVSVSGNLYTSLASGNCLQTGAGGLVTSTGVACGSGGSGNSAFTIGNGIIYNATSTDLVGIGTSNPLTTLYVQGKSGTSPFTVASSTGSTALFAVDQVGNVNMTGSITLPSQINFNSSVFTQFQATVAGINLDFKTVAGNGDIVFTPNAVDTLFVTHNQFVGVGSSTPAATLGVKGVAGATPAFMVSSSTNAQLLSVAANGSTTINSLGTGIVRANSGSLYIDPNTYLTSISLTGGATISGSSFTFASGSPDTTWNILCATATCTFDHPNNLLQGSFPITAVLGGTGTTTVPTQQGQLLAADSSGAKYGPTTLVNSATLTFATGTVAQISANVLKVPNAVTFNNGGAGASSGQTFDGSGAATISYNTIGAQPTLTNPDTGTGVSGQVTVWSGTTSHTGDAGFLWSTGNHTLSVNSSTPQATLVVQGSSTNSTTLDIFRVASSSSATYFDVTAKGNVGVNTSTPAVGFVIQNAQGTNDIFRMASSSGATLALFDYSGHLQIGTTTMSSNIAIQGSAGQTLDLFDIASSSGANILSVTPIAAGSASSYILNLASTSGVSLLSLDGFGNERFGGLVFASSSAPTVATSTGCGSASCSATITGGFSYFSLSVGASSTPAANAVIVKITGFPAAAPNKLICTFSPANINAASSTANSILVFASSTPSEWDLVSGSTALTGSVTYNWDVACGGR